MPVQYKGVNIYDKVEQILPWKQKRITSPGAMSFRRQLILPNCYNMDPSYEEILGKIFYNCHRRFESYQIKPDDVILENQNLYPGPMTSLLTKSGYYMGPCGVTPVTNEGIGREPSTYLLNAISIITKMTSNTIEPSSIELNSISTSGMPDWTKSAEDKRKLADNLLLNFDQFRSMWSKRDMQGLFDKFRFVLGAHQTFRSQQDKSEVEFTNDWFKIKEHKQRKVVSFETFDEIIADKTIENSDFSRMRIRLAVAYSFVMNFVLRVMERAWSNYQSRFERTFKARGADDICSKLGTSEHIVAIDYSQFDQSIKDSALKAVVDNTPLPDDLKEFALTALYPVMMVFGDSPRTKGQAKYYGNLMDPFADIENRKYGLTSGHGWVSYIGKVVGSAQAIELLYEAGIIDNSDESIVKIIQGTYPGLVLLNTGDDNLFGFDKLEDQQKLRRLLKQGSERSMVNVGEEIPAAYLGFNFKKLDRVRTETGNKWLAVNRIESAPRNFLVPEHGIDSKMRAWWPIGRLEEPANYRSNELYELYAEIRDKVIRDVLKYDFDAKTRAELDFLRHQFGDSLDFTPEERRFLQNPDRRHYEDLDMTQIRDEIKESFFKTFPVEEHERFVEMIFN